MRPHAGTTGSTRARRGLSALLLLPLLLVLAGCFRLDMDLTITEEETLDVSMEVGDLTGMASRDDMDCSTLESEITGGPENVDFAVADIEDDEGNVGCRITATDAPIDAMTGEGLDIERVEDTYVFSFDGDPAGMGDPSQFEDMAGMEPQVSITVTFPGEVIESDGQIDGNTVTWTGVEAFATGGSATGEATGSGLGGGGVSTVVWIILGVVVLLGIAALIFFLSRRNRAGAGADDAGAPYGGAAAAPYGQPADQPGHPVQNAGGYGPPDQVPADPGPGYPGDQQPSAAGPATTAAADSPVARPQDSPYAPPAEPGAAQDTPYPEVGEDPEDPHRR